MSCEAITRVWDLQGVTAEERLMLIWLANSSARMGAPVMVNHYDMGQFICADYYRAAAVLADLEAKGLVISGEDEEASYLWLAYDGRYDLPINWTSEPRSRSRRLEALIERDGPRCAYCDGTPVTYHIDHFVPKAKGGPNAMSNFLLACAPCNQAKRDKMPEEFLRDRPELFRTLCGMLECFGE